ncbi:MAG: single-stranded-DNA-specific exonuclease RecJ [Armatimonadetes bacterium]|nr:single-stranded-DNA-specific exonuclease RecJ [Armatimonadota bacterium]MDE2207331.1 single-stranded-DNA-specific exonuclease RecJ [Armatimonadota bacterium]
MRRISTFGRMRWNLPAAPEPVVGKLLDAAGGSRLLAGILASRGCASPEAAHRFLHPSLSQLAPAVALPDIDAACARVIQAIKNGERIRVFGDYDGDGLTSAALWYRFLRRLNADVDVRVPHRLREGYDLRIGAIEAAHAEGRKLIITCDCGTTRLEEVERAQALGMDVVITDHHEITDQSCLPSAVAVVNPNRPDAQFPFRDMAGVGVAFRVCEEIAHRLGVSRAYFHRAFLDLAAVGTVTDMMPLLEDNRVIVAHGLRQLEESTKSGLVWLRRVSGCDQRQLHASHIGFQIGPRLNAAGRMSDPARALELLTTDDDEVAQAIAQELNDLNMKRRDATAAAVTQAEVSLQAHGELAPCLVVYNPAWSPGIVGLVAGKLVERYSRPVVAIGAGDDVNGRLVARGSARSIAKFNMLQAITECSANLEEFGGHAHAAGISIAEDKIDLFTLAMARIGERHLTEEDLMPVLEIDASVAPDDLTMETVERLEQLAPFGQGNPEPRLRCDDMRIVVVRRMGSGGAHLRLTLSAGSCRFEAPWFGRGELADVLPVGAVVDACFRLHRDERNGGVELILEDVAPANRDAQQPSR